MGFIIAAIIQHVVQALNSSHQLPLVPENSLCAPHIMLMMHACTHTYLNCIWKTCPLVSSHLPQTLQHHIHTPFRTLNVCTYQSLESEGDLLEKVQHGVDHLPTPQQVREPGSIAAVRTNSIIPHNLLFL